MPPISTPRDSLHKDIPNGTYAGRQAEPFQYIFTNTVDVRFLARSGGKCMSVLHAHILINGTET